MSQTEWKESNLGEFVSIQRGHDLTAEERKPGEVPVMGSAGVNGYHNKALAKGPGVVIGRSGASFGQVHYCPRDYWPHNTILYVTDFNGNDPLFAYYRLKSLDFSAFNTGSAQPSLNRNHLYQIPLHVPPPDEQRAIARVLGDLDDKIELNRRMNATLEAMAQALFESWFVDFEPVRAKAAGLAPEGLDATTAALFPAEFDDSPLGEVPRGWRSTPLPLAVDINPSRTLAKGALAPYLDMANMPTTSARALEVATREFGSGMKFSDGDTLVARITPCLENGKTCYVDFLGDGVVGWGSTEYIVLRPRAPLPACFAYFLARTRAFRDFAIANMTGTSGRQRVPADCFEKFEVVVPSPEIAQEFGRRVSPILATMKVHDLEARSLAALRDDLLPQLLSGELRVPEMADDAR